jgi:outer membrane receptor protein involved in Fe transport
MTGTQRTTTFRRTVGGLRSAVILALLAVTATATAAPLDGQQDLTALPMEQLMNLEVYTASKFAQKVSEAPSAVSIVTAADIKAYGYRTLADILKSIRGVYVTNDRNYSYVGTRGFSRPGDYNSRVLLLLDGYRLNDGIYDGALIGTESIVDVDLIDRVEFVPGPGSAIYGGNAFFGVLNIITKNGKGIGGTEISGEAASFETRKGRLTYGERSENGLDVLLSASSYHSRGENLHFPEFDDPATNNGVAHNLDHDRYEQLFTKLTYGAYSLDIAYSERTKAIPTASFGQVFNDPRSQTVDEQAFFNLKYYDNPSTSLDVQASLYYGHYVYSGDYVFDYPPVTVNRDETRGDWWGGELRFLSTAFDRHKIIYGAEYRNDVHRDQRNFDVDPFVSYLDDHRSKRTYGVYAQDEFSLSDSWILNAGLRQDHSTEDQTATNPRLAVIHKFTPVTTAKLLYGTAFRAPNAYEKYYVTDASLYKANPDLKPEKIKTYEAVLEHYFQNDFRLTGSVFSYKIDNLISLTLDPADGLFVYRNIDTAEAKGVELEAERFWSGGTRLRASYSWQAAKDSATGARLSNSPRHLAKLNFTTPFFGDVWRAGSEIQYTGERTTPRGGTVGDFAVMNLTLTAERFAKNLEVSAGVYNLFDKKYADTPSTEHFDSLGRYLNQIPQDGRSFRLKLTYRH